MLINYSHASFFLTLPVLAPRPWIIVPCAQPSNLAAYTPAFTLRWAGCLTPSTTLVWYGERCGADFSLIQWTGVYAIDKASGQLVPNCHSHYTDPQYRPGTPFGNAVFGGCGVAPTSASLPTKVCSDPSPCISTAAASSFAYTAAITGCGLKSQQVLYTGAPCGPANKLVRWSSFQLKTAAGKVGCPTRAAGAVNPMFDREWFGACGSQPANFGKLPTKLCDGGGGGGGGGGGNNPTPSPAPTPPPSGARLQREALKSGEKSLPGMARIQAVVNNQVPIINADKSVTVAVLDTGGTFLDELNTQTGMSFVGGRRNSDWSDIEKHGTHVSGTIGARNNGFGVFGVLPNVKILPIKVLGNDGGGSMSDIMAAIDYVATNAVSLGIGVINLSLGGTGSVRDPICQSIQAATTRGVVVVVAAGNDGDDLAGYSPASCPATIAVTAISPTANTPAGFSNWLNPGASAAEQRRVVAAPGVNILSTLPDGSYDSWQGTSMASPHVAGAAARCFAAGECKVGDGAANRERFLNSIWAKYDSDPAYRWTSARTPVASGKWYGPLVWADKW
ncbi:peptidase S8 and S53 subtilisin kexinsedolisin [Monoraphidium neglectum]|uniref:Peptidase S8 and S53 subtilisin kexinsedolisin n=1 Tax=Monoraphidium neglectum TaxID=145388 RepID=A0A0D2N815_9CHLO|nr:peptidase S8 and S53 subtilisin kexinsedolisin [Monoraphidium neglectum]KIZ01941.1 peptidase S8 and S53 subtilisin kexinsedolisin [Monoraphidium neglectum]|eukprot:XP_013900960.1 peptidase S8 and S53 subtilisin kexinsedolisin [Monoraphidium neglectum]